MLLLTAVTFGGAESLECFDHLPDDEAELLKHRAQMFLAIPREKRIPLLVQELKRLVNVRRRQLWTADPEALASVLKHERPALVEVVLRALPAPLADATRRNLPRREAAVVKEVRPEILALVRGTLDEVLSRGTSSAHSFKFTDVLMLQSRELITVCDRMGARALATALAGLPDDERQAFFEALPPDQRVLATKAAAAGVSRKLSEADARAILKLHHGKESPSAAMRSAGAQRLARACLAQSPEFAQRVSERHAGEFGRLLQHWLKHEKHRPVTRGDGGRGDIVEQLERLAQKGVIDRPTRLLPPPRLARSGAERAEPEAREAPPPLPGGKLLPPSPRGQLGRELLAPEARPRRDPIAEREARKAGAASSRQASDSEGVPPGTQSRIMRAVGRGGPVSGPRHSVLKGGNPGSKGRSS